MLKKSLFSPAQPWRAETRLFPCGVLASFRPSTGTRPPHHSAARTDLVLLIRRTMRPQGYASALHPLRPCSTNYLTILPGILPPILCGSPFPPVSPFSRFTQPSEHRLGPDARLARLEYSPNRPVPSEPSRGVWQSPDGGAVPPASAAPALSGGPVPVHRRRVLSRR